MLHYINNDFYILYGIVKNMKTTPIDGVIIFKRDLFHDARGYFSELYKDKNDKFTVQQSNISFSKKNVIRGLHIQNNPNQAKFITCVSGSIVDCVVDTRRDSKTFGQYNVFELNEKNNSSLLVPHGCLHGFCALEDSTVIYFVDNVWNKEYEYGVNPFDEDLNIQWPIRKEEVIISDKDINGMSFKDFINLNTKD